MSQLQPPATNCRARSWLGAAVGTGNIACYDRDMHRMSWPVPEPQNIRPGGQDVNYDGQSLINIAGFQNQISEKVYLKLLCNFA